jgi:hypothetical protein
VAGYVTIPGFLGSGGLELLSPQGSVTVLPAADVKQVRFVKTWEPPAGNERKVFPSRPKMQGIWIRLDFRDGDSLEGLLPNQLLEWEPLGFTISPPDTAGNTQRIFVPKSALTGAIVLGVIGTARRTRPVPAADSQLKMFD